MRKLVLAALGLVVAVAGCTKEVNKCDSNADCKDPAYPFCDVDGTYAPSGGEKNVCTIIPPDCPVTSCGCTPNTAISCSDGMEMQCGSDGMSEDTIACALGCAGDGTGCTTCTPGAVTGCSGSELSTCGSDGLSVATSSCALGCTTDGTRCLTFQPSNGLGAALTAAANEPDVVLADGTDIDTGTGVVKNMAGLSVSVTSIVVTQGSTSIRVFLGKSFTFGATTVHGPNAFAAVSPGEIVLTGKLNARGTASTSGPGALSSGGCVGADVQSQLGAGGGGNATAGGNGAQLNAMNPPAAGGVVEDGLSPLLGGCQGGDQRDTSNNLVAPGGGGGGAVQLDSLTDIEMKSGAWIELGGGGGGDAAGGGSGGNAVLEAPSVTIAAAGGITANGGAGGACGLAGGNATSDTTPAVPASCGMVLTFVSGGAGGTITQAPGHGVSKVSSGGGGGGAVGSLRIATKSGTYSASGATISAAVSATSLVTQ